MKETLFMNRKGDNRIIVINDFIKLFSEYEELFSKKEDHNEFILIILKDRRKIGITIRNQNEVIRKDSININELKECDIIVSTYANGLSVFFNKTNQIKTINIKIRARMYNKNDTILLYNTIKESLSGYLNNRSTGREKKRTI